MEQHASPSAQNHLAHRTAHYMAHRQHFTAHGLKPVRTNLHGRNSPASLAPTTQWEPSVHRTSTGVHRACTYTAHGQHFTAHGLEPVRTNLYGRNSLTSRAVFAFTLRRACAYTARGLQIQFTGPANPIHSLIPKWSPIFPAA